MLSDVGINESRIKTISFTVHNKIFPYEGCSGFFKKKCNEIVGTISKEDIWI